MRIATIPTPLLALVAGTLSLTALAGNDDRDRIQSHDRPVLRDYVTVEGRQLHYREARPAPGQDRKRPVIALHQSPNSGQVYVEFMSVLAKDRRVIAPDTPGFGESERPSGQPAMSDYAAIMKAFAAELGLEEVDVVGYHTGASIAVEWAILDPQRVRHLWLVGLPAFDAEERERLAANPWPDPAPLDEDRVAAEWRGSKSWQGPGQSDASIERTFLAKLGSGRTGWWGPAAVFDHDFLDRLALVQQPVLATRPRDDLWDMGERVREALPELEIVDLPELGFAVFEVDPQHMSKLARRAFDGSDGP